MKHSIKVRNILIPVLILVLLLAALLLYRYWNRTIYNDSPVYGKP